MLRKVLFGALSISVFLIIVLVVCLVVILMPTYEEFSSFEISTDQGRTVLSNRVYGFQFNVDSKCKLKIVNLYYLVVSDRFSVFFDCEDREKRLRVTRVGSKYQSDLKGVIEGDGVVVPRKIYVYKVHPDSDQMSIIIFGENGKDSIVIASEQLKGEYLEEILSSLKLLNS